MLNSLVKISSDGLKSTIKEECSLEYFNSLMLRALSRFGVKTIENHFGFRKPSAHVNEFIANNIIFKLEFLPEFSLP